jgi:hypothetical protein
MLFNSYEFIFLFMPVTVLGFAVLSRQVPLTTAIEVSSHRLKSVQ